MSNIEARHLLSVQTLFVAFVLWRCIYSVHNKKDWNIRLVFTACQLLLRVSVIYRTWYLDSVLIPGTLFVIVSFRFIQLLPKQILLVFHHVGIFLSSTDCPFHVFAAISIILPLCALILLWVWISRCAFFALMLSFNLVTYLWPLLVWEC